LERCPLCLAPFGGRFRTNMARYATYTAVHTVPGARIWLVRALFLSIALHIGFFVFAYWKKIENFSFTDQARLAPPQFVAQRVFIYPKTREETGRKRGTTSDTH